VEESSVVDRSEPTGRSDDESQLFRLALGAASAVAWVWDVELDVLSWMGDVETLYGLEGPATCGPSTTFIERVHPEDQGPVVDAVVRSMTYGVDYEIDYRSLFGDGSVRWHRAKGTTVSDATGRVIRMLGVATDITQRRVAEDQLAFLASHDQLTGLANRSHLIERLSAVLERAASDGSLVAVYFLDLDRFKQVNDRFGHGVGDEVLISTARRLRTTLRPPDTICRLGGDEFVVVAQVPSSAEAEQLRSRIVAALVRPHQLGRRVVRCPASVGLRLATATSTPDSILMEADAAMYAAKADRPLGRRLGAIA
jgi:diguanylate cyclase (GGDEF)-like protein/PAS domain S-box-containing protein